MRIARGALLDGLAGLCRGIDQLRVINVERRLTERLRRAVAQGQADRIVGFGFRALVWSVLRHLVWTPGFVFSLSWFRHEHLRSKRSKAAAAFVGLETGEGNS